MVDCAAAASGLGRCGPPGWDDSDKATRLGQCDSTRTRCPGPGRGASAGAEAEARLPLRRGKWGGGERTRGRKGRDLCAYLADGKTGWVFDGGAEASCPQEGGGKREIESERVEKGEGKRE